MQKVYPSQENPAMCLVTWTWVIATNVGSTGVIMSLTSHESHRTLTGNLFKENVLIQTTVMFKPTILWIHKLIVDHQSQS